MLDLTVRTLAWMLSLCTPPPRGRHRLGTLLPPLRITPSRHRTASPNGSTATHPASYAPTYSTPPNTAANANVVEPPAWQHSAST